MPKYKVLTPKPEKEIDALIKEEIDRSPRNVLQKRVIADHYKEDAMQAAEIDAMQASQPQFDAAVPLLRKYQGEMLTACVKNNALVVLPTGKDTAVSIFEDRSTDILAQVPGKATSRLSSCFEMLKRRVTGVSQSPSTS